MRVSPLGVVTVLVSVDTAGPGCGRRELGLRRAGVERVAGAVGGHPRRRLMSLPTRPTAEPIRQCCTTLDAYASG